MSQEEFLAILESQGNLNGNSDRIKIARMVESQRRVNKWMIDAARRQNRQHQMDRTVIHTFLSAIMYIGEHCPNVFDKALDIQKCSDVYCLGPWPRGDWDDRRKKIAMRVSALVASLNRPLMFGGFTLKEGRIYLLAAG